MNTPTRINPHHLLAKVVANAAKREEAGEQALEAAQKLIKSGLVAKQPALASLAKELLSQGNSLMSSSALHYGFAAKCYLPPLPIDDEKNMGAVLTASPQEVSSEKLENRSPEVIETGVIKTAEGVINGQA